MAGTGNNCMFFKKCYNSISAEETKKFLNNLEKKSPGIKSGILKSNYKIKPFLEKRIKKGEIRRCKICGEPSSKDTCKACELLKLSTSNA